MLPVRHEVPPVPLGAEDDEADGAAHRGHHEVSPDPAENLDPVILVNAEQVHHGQGDGDQHPNEAECEEKLSRHKERCKNIFKLDFLV